jgi:hypothetical protein
VTAHISSQTGRRTAAWLAPVPAPPVLMANVLTITGHSQWSAPSGVVRCRFPPTAASSCGPLGVIIGARWAPVIQCASSGDCRDGSLVDHPASLCTRSTGVNAETCSGTGELSDAAWPPVLCDAIKLVGIRWSRGRLGVLWHIVMTRRTITTAVWNTSAIEADDATSWSADEARGHSAASLDAGSCRRWLRRRDAGRGARRADTSYRCCCAAE